MDYKKIINVLGFYPKENTKGVFFKKYPLCNDYSVEIDFDKEYISYGDLITIDSKTTQNFSKPENWVVLECVNRLLDKGYQPQNITLEKSWSAGHGVSKFLDVCVTRDDGSEYMMIECKTYGKEFNKALTRMHKDGGQLFTYFKFSNKADIIMLYASELKGEKFVYQNEIIKIEEDYRIGDVKDFYEKWNKLTKDNGVFDVWVQPYNFVSKALTKKQLKAITQQDSSFIFNRFLEILRHNVVSDKGNAFNKIFTLFLCKVYDETSKREDEELDFQWKEGVDNDIDFQIRLTELYKNGMQKFLDRTVSDFDEEDFEKVCANVPDEAKKYLLKEVQKLRLEKNNEFAIKEVYDHDSFVENGRVVKEVVELLQKFRIRYNKRQQYLSDFFELLLTTGLKQEAGQFFTSVPLAQFIIKSLPLDDIIEEKLAKKDGELLPYMIDYAAGSGHFLTEYMHEVQSIINEKAANNYIDTTKKKIRNWQEDHFDWATQYVYGIEKDYRLVKVGKVGCYLHGDGLANVILSDGLGNFEKTKEYKGKLKKKVSDESKDNQQFDILLSNPPYSVSSFKQTTRNYYTEKDFELYNSLTDNSSEIEALFIERTKQLLKDGGIAGIILPSSILSNAGIYTKAREIILQYFDIIALAEFGSNTFMATGTNTVVLFLRRRNNHAHVNLRNLVDNFVSSQNDVTLNGIEKPISKYVNNVWEGLEFTDYLTLINKQPNEKVETHELYQDYRKKIKTKNDSDFWNAVIELELEKIFYFILAYPQHVVLVRSGEKQEEKNFLGYEFSNRRGSEGIHPIRRGESIDECTQMFDTDVYDNFEKASTYIYKAYKGDFDCKISDNLKQHISRANLVDLFTFDRTDFEKNLNLSNKKKVKYEHVWETENLVALEEISNIQKGTSITKEKTQDGNIPVVAGGQDIAYFHNKSNRKGNIITVSASGAYSGFVNYFSTPIFASDCNTIQSKNETFISTKLIYQYLKTIQKEMYYLQRGQAQPHVYAEDIAKVKIPLPSKDVQKQIVDEIEILERKEQEASKNIEELRAKIDNIIVRTIEKTKEVTSLRKSGLIFNPSKSELSLFDDDMLVSFIDMASVSNNGYISQKLDRTINSLKKGSYTYFAENDIIIAKITPCMENGKCAIASGLTNGIGLGSSEFHVLRANNSINIKYLFLLLNRKNIRVEAEANMTGASGHRRVPISFYENLQIPLPLLPEQEKIVEEIRQIEKQISELEAQFAAIPKQKENILKKYL